MFTIDHLATGCFGLAVLHTFLTSTFTKLAHRFPDGSVKENLFHLLGEVEVVFGFWAGVFFVLYAFSSSFDEAVRTIDGINFTEPLFVFAVMTVASTKPIIEMAENFIVRASRLFSKHYQSMAIYFICLTLGPLLGSFITEPAAMTVTALVLRDQFYKRQVSNRFKYVTLAILFVNISIGGVLTPYAAPPVLMVAGKWGWDIDFMMHQFGYKAVVAVFINATLALLILAKEIRALSWEDVPLIKRAAPTWLTIVHLLFLAGVVLTSHHPSVFMGLFMFFIGVTVITPEFQDTLKIRQSLLVAYFLAGLVVLGEFQDWWLAPLLAKLDALPLFLGATGLTAFTDNAALTYLGSQVEGISEVFKYALVAGAVSGGGLTVIANAPNPAGFSILQKDFGEDGISPLQLFLFAIIPTIISMTCFWLL
ncbi:MAG: putative Na+/H+ antiporter [Bdellovibrionales bacterium]|nr:putative Na+/H+ antiporter [Bdellovibrionales bacterium]